MMKHPDRRRFLHLAAGAAALPAVSRIASAQTYPARPVRLLVGFPPGGVGDIVARLMGQWLSERLGQPFIIENRPGAAGNIAAEAVVRSVPDGHTLLWVTSSNAISATLHEKLSFDFVRDIAPSAGIIRTPLVMVVNPSFPAKTVPEFVAYAKGNPGKINMASGGNATTAHLAGEMFNLMAGIKMVHVPYRGAAPALTDLIAGHVHVAFEPVPSFIEYIRTGKLRALAVTTTTRSEALPDIPTLSDFVSGYEASAWFGVGTARSTPTEIIDRLNREINAGLADSTIKAKLADLGGMVLAGSPGDFAKFIAEEIEKWGKVIRAASIKPE